MTTAWSWTDAPAGLTELNLRVLQFDLPDRDVNVFTPDTLEELGERLDDLKADPPDALVIASGKHGSYIAGADVDHIRSVKDAEEGQAAAEMGQRVLRRLSRLGFPTIALIDGACVGGGAELACWCTGRVASTDDRTRIGFPEVKLGIVPGFGGTQRLPGIVGLPQAIALASSGRLLTAKQALRIGLVDAIGHRDYLMQASATLAERFVAGKGPKRSFRSNWPVARGVVGMMASRAVRKAAGAHYPAPMEAVKLCGLALRTPLDEGLEREARTIGRLVTTRASQSLLHVYDLSRESQAGGEKPPKGGLLGVLGAGVMGGGIAGVAAAKGYRARMRDISPDGLGKGVKQAAQVIERAKRRSHDRRTAVQAGNDRLSYSLGLDGFAGADLVVEAVVEIQEIKEKVLAELEGRVSEHCVIATNTSSLSVKRLSEVIGRPERFVGMHFFNPVAKMPLVEVIRGPKTSDETVARVVGWAKALGKNPVVVGDAPGFLVNRVLMPYLSEALRLQSEGLDIAKVDAAAKAFGMPMGPFRLLDEVGIDVASKVARTFSIQFPDRFSESPALKKMSKDGRLGRKSGGGFYEYEGGKSRGAWKGLSRPDEELDRQTITDRLMLRMADEGFRCLEEGVAASARDVDLATVFGVGFPPFLGGLCRWVGDEGPQVLLDRLIALCEEHGGRFEPSRRWRNIAAGKPLYR
jgi:3-hydroxyacyl-CoA dehydrogenase/enoyl-CoA hydratase/3-hydroxybutyryl-CoA epimerase